MPDVLVSVDNISKKYCRSLKKSLWYGVQDMAGELFGSRGGRELRPDEFWAVKDLSFELKRGECIGLIGPNGSGKSTLLKMLCGLINIDSGRITMRGKVGALIELGAGFNPILTGRENIYINASVLGCSKRETDRKLDEIINFADIEGFIDTPVQNYSSGMKVRLGFAVAAQMEPDILLIDEVLAVGDKGFIVKCMNHLWKMKKKGTAIILVSHSMYHVNAFADKAILLNKGTVDIQGETLAVTDRYENLFQMLELEKTVNECPMNVNFKKAYINTSSEEPHKVIMSGDRFCLVVHFCITDNLENGLVIGVSFRANDGQIIAGFLTKKDEFRSYVEKGDYTMSVLIDNNIFLEGKYTVGVSAFDYDYTQNLGFSEPITVLNSKTYNYSPLDLVGKVLLNNSVTIDKC